MFSDLLPGSWQHFWQVLHGDWNLRERDLCAATGQMHGLRIRVSLRASPIHLFLRNERTWSWLMVTVTAKTRLYRLVSRNWHSAAMACCQHNIQQRPPERILPLMGWTAVSRCQLQSWQRTACEEKGKERTPHGSVSEDEMVTQTVGSTQACVRLASMWECLGKHSVLSPPTQDHAQTHCCPALNTWYISSGIWPRWLLAAALRLRQLGVLALPLHQLPVAPPG